MPSLSICIVKNNTIVWSKAYRYFDIKNNKLAKNDTIYMAGSISKSFTATAILQLYEQGLVDLDEDVSKYLGFNFKNPKYPNVNITLRMLLSHTASIAKNDLKFMLYFYLKNYSYNHLEEFLNLNNPGIWFDKKPGTTHLYSNIGFEILGYILEKQTNKSIEEYCKEHIFTPLNMYNTSFHVKNLNKSRLAVPYLWFIKRYFSLKHYDLPYTAAGSLRTNVLDLSHFMIAHMNNGTYNGIQILNNTTVKLMHTVHGSGPMFDYGLGWIIFNESDGKYYGHGGSTFGGEAVMKYRVSDNVGVIYFWNQYIGIRGPLQVISYQLIQKAIFEKTDEL